MSSNIYLIIVDEQTKDVNIKKIAKEPSKQNGILDMVANVFHSK